MSVSESPRRSRTHRRALAVAASMFLALGVGSAIRAANALGLWTALPNPPTAHQDHTATLLGDGKILVAGGFVSLTSSGLTYSSAAALYRPVFGDWLAVPPMGTPRGSHGAGLAGNGTVVVAGGSTNGAGLNFSTDPNCGLGLGTTAISSVEVFDPSTLTWAAAASMSQARNEFSLVRLANGTLLAAGGADSTAAEIYDAATDTWSSAGGMHSSRVGAAYTLMPGGGVMVAGGNFGAIWPFCDSTAEVYDPSANTWTSTGSMALDRRNATATVVRMPNGTHRVLVAGGIDNRGSSIESSAELYDPATNTWTATGSMTTPRVGHTATLMTRTGLVLVTGGSDGTSVLSSAEVYDPSTGTWMALNPMATARSSHTATQLLIPGITKVAIVGGSDGTPGTAGLSSAELFQPTPLPSRTFLSASGPCQPITLTAFVSSTTGTGTPTGTVAFKDGATTLATVGLDASAEASLPLGMLPDGSHAFSASYSGDDSFDASLGTLAQVASTAPTVTIPGTFPARTLGTSVTLSASVSGGSAPYSYAWQRDGSSLTGGATLTDTPALGVNSYELTVTDASGCASVAALAQVDVFDFTVAVTPAEVTLLRGGLAQGVSAAVTLVNGSSTSGLPAAVVIGSGGAPADLTGLSGTVPLPHTAGATAVGALSLHPGPSSLGDFAASVTASVGAGTRSASLGLHLFDFGLSLAPSDVTGYRAGYPLGLLVTSTVTPGSTAQRPASFGLVASLPPDATYAVSPTLGLSSSAPLTIDPGPASSGTFPFTVTALSPLGSRSAAGTLHLLVDTTPPVIGVTVTGTVGTNGWYVSDATVSWTVSDAETLVTSTTGCATTTLTSDTAGTTFTCSATSDGGPANRSVTVKRDVSPPTLTLPGPITVNANQPGGARVSYAAVAGDDVDPSPSVACTPASGALFPVGPTTVSCQATNAAGLSAGGTFTVTVLGAAQQAGNLGTLVNSLPTPPGNSLTSKLQDIVNDINAGNTAGACAALGSFMSEVSAQRGKKISIGDADALLQAAQTLRNALGC